MRLRRGRRDQEEADQDQAKILKVSLNIFLRYQHYLCCWYCSQTFIGFESQSDIIYYLFLYCLFIYFLCLLFYFIFVWPCWEYRSSCVQGCLHLTWERILSAPQILLIFSPVMTFLTFVQETRTFEVFIMVRILRWQIYVLIFDWSQVWPSQLYCVGISFPEKTKLKIAVFIMSPKKWWTNDRRLFFVVCPVAEYEGMFIRGITLKQSKQKRSISCQ